MNLNLLIENLTSPALLFFVMGILAVQLKSDLEIPKSSSKFISLYLLFSIGFNGGRELAHSQFSMEIIWTILFGVITALVIPIYTFYLLRRKLSTENSGAIAAAYGSISAVTFVTAVSFLEIQQISYSGHMVALMALMEAPAIIVGVALISLYGKKDNTSPKMSSLIGHSFSNGSVLMILGSLIIGFVASESQAQGIAPFTNDIFKGFLAIFLLDMGIISGRKLTDFIKSGWFTTLFAIIIPVINGCTVAWASGLVTGNVGDRFMLAILAASASYIAVPAAMKMAVPKANPGLYLPMALAVTFPFNITFGMPLYMALIVI
ncbi:sodium-dependent bicarbonate transport family permease [Salinimicrobium sp. TH3]|uniref:sodium-dependent bicarbonate transport family permease n=1 Tax=Salinimicrobium sp. TH3 TaxID=2997342 RepID=UPI002275F081|nr:sodium-dependent bicarbonate transport family permease [Salinimicrobium sp. TH3]MCY2688451.1 sodium-dependent bicarbonate transport family permease [Salinimicrobium sp. TH3]